MVRDFAKPRCHRERPSSHQVLTAQQCGYNKSLTPALHRIDRQYEMPINVICIQYHGSTLIVLPVFVLVFNSLSFFVWKRNQTRLNHFFQWSCVSVWLKIFTNMARKRRNLHSIKISQISLSHPSLAVLMLSGLVAHCDWLLTQTCITVICRRFWFKQMMMLPRTVCEKCCHNLVMLSVSAHLNFRKLKKKGGEQSPKVSVTQAIVRVSRPISESWQPCWQLCHNLRI